MLPITYWDEHLPVGQNICHPHTGAPVVAHGIGNVALQGHHPRDLRADREYRHHVASLKCQALAIGVERKVFDVAGHAAALVNPLELRPLRRSQSRQSAGQCQQLAYGLALIDLVHRRHVHRAHDSNPCTSRRNKDDVPGHQGQVTLVIALGQESIKIYRGYGFATAAQLDGPQTPVDARSARLKQRVDQAREAADHVLAGLASLPDNKDLDAAQAAHGGGDGEVAVDAAYVGAKHPLRIAQGNPG